MLQSQFEELLGRKVDPEIYHSEIEVVYNNLSANIDHQKFVELYKNFPHYFEEFHILAKKLETAETRIQLMRNSMMQSGEQILMENEGDQSLCNVACSLMGEREYFNYKLQHNLELTDNDKRVLRELISTKL